MKSSFSCCGVSCCSNNPISPERRLDARISQKEIGLVYDKLSAVYDIWGKLTESRARNRAIELAAIEDGQNILEVAVGTGLAFYEIVKRNPARQQYGYRSLQWNAGEGKKTYEDAARSGITP